MNAKVHEIRAQYTSGKTYQQLAEEFSLSVGTISRMAKGAGAYAALSNIARKPGRRPGSSGGEGSAPKFDEETQRQIRVAYAMGDVTFRQLAEEHGVSHTTIQSVVRRTGAYAEL